MKYHPPLNAYWADTVASLATSLAAHDDSADVDAPEAELAAPAEPPPAPPPGLPWAVGGLLAIAAAIALLSDPARLLANQGLAIVLGVGVVVLDRVRIDVFDRARVSPGGVMSLALAFLFGPLGVVLAETLVALDRSARRMQRIRIGFDLSNQVVAGAAASGTYVALHGSIGTVGAATAGALANYAVSAGLLSVVVSVTTRTAPLAVWREQFAWLSVHYVVFGALAGGLVLMQDRLGAWSVAIFVLPVGLLWIAERQYLSRTRRNVAELRERNAELETAHDRLEVALDHRQRLLERAHTAYLRTITTLARAVQARDPYAEGRCERVTRLAQRLAGDFGFSDDDRNAFAVGVLCADIGKIAIPDRLLQGRGKLSERDYEKLRSYPETSAFIIAELDLPQIVTDMARHHLERWDGTGGPDALSGDEIPLAARILAVADALDHKTSAGEARVALPLDAALTELQMETGPRFCPTVVAALRRCLDLDPALRSYFGEGAFSHEGTHHAR